MTAFAVGLAIMSWLPGHLILKLSRGEVSEADWSERRFAEVSISVVILLWISVTLGTLGVLSRGALLAVAALAASGAAGALWKRHGRLPLRPGLAVDRTLLLVIGLAILTIGADLLVRAANGPPNAYSVAWSSYRSFRSISTIFH